MDSIFDHGESGANMSLTSTGKIPHQYNAEEIALMLAALGACVASVIYSFKHVKSSSCMGVRCQQAVEGVIVQDVPAQPPALKRATHLNMSETEV